MLCFGEEKGMVWEADTSNILPGGNVIIDPVPPALPVPAPAQSSLSVLREGTCKQKVRPLAGPESDSPTR